VTAVGGIGGAGGITPLQPPTMGSATGSATSATSGPSFQNGLDAVAKSLNSADVASAQVATGTATDLHAVTIAATKAQLGVQLTVAMRDKAVDAYQEIMRMSV
jgi:flagellar hook-basal body complex protein FliE